MSLSCDEARRLIVEATRSLTCSHDLAQYLVCFVHIYDIDRAYFLLYLDDAIGNSKNDIVHTAVDMAMQVCESQWAIGVKK